MPKAGCKELLQQKILESQVNTVPGDELNPVVKDAYNQVVWSFDLYRQFQFYNWHIGLDDSEGLSGYLLCSNAEPYFVSLKE